MPVSHLRRIPLVALTLLVLASGMAPARTMAASEEAPEADTITTVLYPGWNMVGWVGPSTSTSELFDAIPALRQVSAWDADAQAHLHALRRRYGELPTLTPGMGLWLRLSGDSTVEWARAVSRESVLLSLRAGENLVGWTGQDGTPVAEAVARLGDAVVLARGWDAQTQRYVRYIPVSSPAGDVAELRHGAAVWIEASHPVGWWQPGAQKPPFTFHGDIPEDTQAAIIAAYEGARAFFAVRFGAVGRGRHHYIGADTNDVRTIYRAVFGRDPGTEGFCGRTDFVAVTVRVLRCAYLFEGGAQAAEYLDALISETARKGSRLRGRPRLDPRGPGWLIEGSFEYARHVHDEAAGFRPSRSREDWNGWARRTELPLQAFEVTENRSGWLNGAEAGLGFFAVEWLADRAGDPAVFEYFRLIRDTDDWQDAFGAAFGISADDFYEQFADYRAATFPRLPHLTDAREEAVLVVLEGVPLETALAIRSEFEDVRQFFADRFEAEATEFTLYVAADAEEALAAIPGWHDSKSCRRWPLYGVGALTLAQCGASPPLDYFYVGGLIRELAHKQPIPASGIASGRAPAWFDDGAIAYAEAMYGEAAGTLVVGEFHDLAASAAVYNPVSAPDLSTSDGARAAGRWPTRALGFLAVEWLADHAGDPAVFDYYRRLPDATSRDEAFEGAFGLTFEEFHEQFEAYRATLEAP